MTADVRELRGLLDATIEYYVADTDYLQVELATIYGTALNRIPVEGLVTVDFISSDTASTGKVYNVTDDTDVTITAVESPLTPGSYTLTFSSPQTIGDKIQVMGKKNGFDFSGLLGHEGTLA
jgi:hypothetical protein